MPHQVFTDDYIRKLCPENQPIPLKKMSVLRSPKPPKYVESLPGIRYVPPVTRPPVTVNIWLSTPIAKEEEEFCSKVEQTVVPEDDTIEDDLLK